MSGNGTDYTLTPNLGLYKPIANMAVGLWGDLWNSNADAIDSAIHASTGGGPYLPLAGNATVFGPTTFSSTLNVTGAATFGSIGFNSTAPPAKPIGWGAPTGTATRSTFVTSTVTLPALAEHVKALIDDLTAYGLIGP